MIFMFNTNNYRTLFIFLTLIILLNGCGDDEYTLYLTIEGKGVISLNNTGYEVSKTLVYEANEIVTVMYINDYDDWEFVEYTGDLTGSSSSTNLTMDSDKRVTATFSLENSVQVNGSVSDSDDNPLEGVVIYSEAGANQVSGVTDSNGEYSISNVPVTSDDKRVDLLFEKNGFASQVNYFYKDKPIMSFQDVTLHRVYNLEVNNVFYNKGSVSPVHKTYTLTENEVKTLSATTYSNALEFDKWFGDVPSTENVYSNSISVTMDKNRTIFASFNELTTYTIQLHSNYDDYGTVTQDPEGVTQVAGSKIELSNTPEEGYMFSYWMDHHGQIYDTNALTITLNEDNEYTCVFNKQSYQLTIEKTGEGSYRINPSSDTLRYLKDTQVTLIAIPASGWLFRKWQQGSSVNANQQVNIVMDSDKSISLTFEWPYAEFMGQVIELNNGGLANVKVMAGPQSTTTNNDGYFYLKADIPKNADTMILLLQKSGYCLQSTNYSVYDQIMVNVSPTLSQSCNVLESIIQALKILSGQNGAPIAFDIEANSQNDLSEIIFMMKHLAE